jgi:hypothetical protein
MGIRDARACQTNTNYSYLETDFYLPVEYQLDFTAVVLYVYFLFGTFFMHNLININRIIRTLSVVHINKNRKREIGIVSDLDVGSDYFYAPFLMVYIRSVPLK